MVTTDTEKVVFWDDAEGTTRETESEQTAEKPQKVTAEQWIQNVQAALEEVLPERKQAELKELFALAKIAKEAQASKSDPLGKQVREYFEGLDPGKIEQLLKELEGISQQNGKALASVPEEVVVYKRELEQVRDEAVRRHGEPGSVAAATRGSLERQVFENFSHYLEEGAKIQYGGDRLEVHRTSDGVLRITVPTPSYENMLALAGELGNLQEKYTENPLEYAEMLKTAALIMANESIYGASAIEALYNAGYKLEQAAKKLNAQEHFDLGTIQRLSRESFAEQNPRLKGMWERKVKEAYLKIFLGEHDVDFIFDGDRLKINTSEEAKQGKAKGLYDVLFDQWQKSNEGRNWLGQHRALLGNVNDPSVREQIVQAYNTWLYEGKRDNGTLVRGDLLKRMKGFVEQKVSATGAEDKKYELLFSKWRHLLLETKIAQDISQAVGERMQGKSAEDQLKAIAQFFQPNGQVEYLNYLPSDVLRIFQQNGPQGKRNEAACIIADSYVKNILQKHGFDVLTHLKDTHSQLIAIDRKTGDAYYVDPSAPTDAVRKIEERALLEQIREYHIPSEGEKLVNPAAKPEWRGKGKISLKTADGARIAEGSGLLTSGFISNMIDTVEPPLPKAVRSAAAQRAKSVFEENPIAWLQMAKYATGEKKKEYLERAVGLGLDRAKAEALLQEGEKIQIGNWTPGNTGNADIDNLVADANTWIAASPNPGGGLEQLTTAQLQSLIQSFESLIRTNATIAGDPNLLADTFARLEQANEALRTKQREKQGPTLFTPLTPRQIDILEQGGAGQIRDLIEGQIKEVSREIKSGAFLNQNAQGSIQEKLHPVKQYLDARISQDPTNPDIRKEREYIVRVIELYQSLTNVVGLIESGDPKKVEQAVDYANQMDVEGGLMVLHTVSTMHEGRPVGLVSDLRREMKQMMQENFQKEVDAGRPGKYFLTHEDYQRLPKRIIDQQISIASQKLGPYAAKYGVLSNPADPTSAYTPDSLREIEEQITIDIKLAQMLFVTTGEASAIYIQGRMPDNVYDGGAMQFLNAQWQNLWRYFEITPQNQKVAKEQFENACREHLAEVGSEETKRLVKQMLKDEGLFNKYIEANALNILAPQVNFWWENRFIRTLPMVRSLNEYENAIYAGVGGRAPVEYVQIIRKDINQPAFIPIRGDPEFGILLRAYLYGGGDMYNGEKGDPAKGIREEQMRMLRGKAADYFPDILIEPFSHQSATEYTDRNFPADTRFVGLFSDASASFLDVGAIPRGEPAYQRAVRRFTVFQANYRPRMDAIRNKRINNPSGNPVQTNFAINNGTDQSARVDIEAMCTALGGNADTFQAFIGRMQELVKGTGTGEDGLAHTLAYDPMFENQWYSPMSLIDVPMWMIDGDDLRTSNGDNGADRVTEADRKEPLRIQLGGNDRVGRQFKDVLELGEKSRAGLIKLLKGNANSPAEMLKIIEQISEGIGATRGSPMAHEVEIMTGGKYLLMNFPQLADAFGFKDGVLFFRGENTAYRKILGSRIASMSREEIMAIAEEHFMPKMPPKDRAKLRKILRIRGRDRLKRFAGQTLFIFLLSAIFATSGAVVGAVNPAEQGR